MAQYGCGSAESVEVRTMDAQLEVSNEHYH